MKLIILLFAIFFSTSVLAGGYESVPGPTNPTPEAPITRSDNQNNDQNVKNMAIGLVVTCGIVTLYQGFRYNSWKFCWKYREAENESLNLNPEIATTK